MTESLLPIIIIITPIIGIFFVFILKDLPFKYIREITALTFQGIKLILGIIIVSRVLKGEILTAANNALFVDGLSAFMIILACVMIMIIMIYSIKYVNKERENGTISDNRVTLYYSLVLLFSGTMMWTVTTNHMVMLYVAMEGTTLSTALLVAFYRKKASLEAGFKYVLLVVTGITMSLFGIVLIFASAVPHLPQGANALLLTEVGKIAPLIPRNIALFAVVLMIAGFGTKAGLVPFHAWLPDAHAEAPTPISAVLSGIIINVGAYALARTVTIFSPHYHAIVVFIAILASISMLIGILMAIVQDDLKRMLAFSSVSQISYVCEGLGLGTYLGIYGGLFHVINHTIVKTLLFLCVGAIMYATNGVRSISKLGGLASKMPITAFCFIVGALSISGMPPFNGFFSKFTIFLALGKQELYWALIISVFTSILTLACMVWALYRIFWRKPIEEIVITNPGEVKEVPFLMGFSIIILAILCIVIGIFPQVIHPILDKATRAILAIWAGKV